eukprot:TRINITY_DN3795_c4_g1_i1.p1 TRINITY_DN3795_c4_g1~~TRINITY_DN3795_c4_g1_i1.p1  ORF type:complete len:148 (+),score=11.50 TRINITY_DN3795_c4_g1_i1:47-490(+)
MTREGGMIPSPSTVTRPSGLSKSSMAGHSRSTPALLTAPHTAAWLGLSASVANPTHGVTRYRGRPALDYQRAAGLQSGGPLKRDYLTKFENRPDRRERIDRRAPCEYHLSRSSWMTMKYDMNWNAYNDVSRPYCPSDLTGFPKQYLG